jgi:hypothetical protein
MQSGVLNCLQALFRVAGQSFKVLQGLVALAVATVTGSRLPVSAVTTALAATRATCRGSLATYASTREQAMMDYSPDLQPEEKYNAFLYEPITEQDNGTPVSVLSALTRGNHDPWEEAARLSRLPPDRAQRVLVELLNESVGRKLSFAEKEAAAKRLLPLLPAGIGFVPIVSGSPAATDAARHLVYWLAWFGFIAMLLLVRPQDRAPMADP